MIILACCNFHFYLSMPLYIIQLQSHHQYFSRLITYLPCLSWMVPPCHLCIFIIIIGVEALSTFICYFMWFLIFPHLVMPSHHPILIPSPNMITVSFSIDPILLQWYLIILSTLNTQWLNRSSNEHFSLFLLVNFNF